MLIAPIAACDLQMTIGKEGRLPWHLPADLRYFKETTMGKPVVMGRRTFESLDGPLIGRRNIVLTRCKDYGAEGIETAHSVDAACEMAAEEAGEGEEVMILGGATVYEVFLPVSDRLYLNVVHERFEGDTFFPAFDIDQWTISSADHREADEENPYPLSFFVLERTADKPLFAQRQKGPGELPGPLSERS